MTTNFNSTSLRKLTGLILSMTSPYPTLGDNVLVYIFIREGNTM